MLWAVGPDPSFQNFVFLVFEKNKCRGICFSVHYYFAAFSLQTMLGKLHITIYTVDQQMVSFQDPATHFANGPGLICQFQTKQITDELA